MCMRVRACVFARLATPRTVCQVGAGLRRQEAAETSHFVFDAPIPKILTSILISIYLFYDDVQRFKKNPGMHFLLSPVGEPL